MDQVAGGDVARFIQEAGAGTARELLVGCVLDDQRSEEGWPITGIGEDGSLACLSPSGEPRRVPLARLSGFLVVDDRRPPRLRRTLEARLPVWEKDARRRRAALERSGLVPSSAEDARILAEVLAAVSRGEIPTFDEEQRFYEACKRAAATPDRTRRRKALQAGVRVFRAIERLGQRRDPGVRVKLAFCLRHAGETRAALEATAFIEDARACRRVSPETLAVLATERAAALADLYESEQDGSVLSRADYWARRALALSRGCEEARLAWCRIRSLGMRGG
ncbi:MAG: hypothetical protein N2Z67_05670 [Acetobacteraceae bacterium]|nr:hypothetical protein [Acetobacteraceae bacterium]